MNLSSISGSKWWKCDFHNHTPASSDYGKGENQAILIKRTAREWLLDYMKAEIDCVGVTDHNSGEWIDKLKEELINLATEQPEGYRPLVLFPGVEISVNGGIHVLAILDPSKGTRDIDNLLGAVEFPSEYVGTSEATTVKSLTEVIKTIISRGGVAIPAHVDKACGLFHIYNGGLTVKNLLNEESLLAIEVVNHDYDFPETYKQLRERLNLAEIVGSDSHVPEQVGSAYTWVKMESPNIEALKLAFHDGREGIIRHEATTAKPNQIENRYFLRKVLVRDGYKAGNGTPLEVEFSPWQTSLIGGRGSGKSSIINYLRIALDKCTGVPSSIKADIDSFRRTGSRGGVGMLKQNTEIEVEFQKDGRLLKLLWKYSSNECNLSEYSNGAWNSIGPINELNKLYPVRIFSQKELYELTESPNHIINLVDSQFDKFLWSQTLKQLESKWLALRQRQREVENQLSKQTAFKEEYTSITSKILIFESHGNELFNRYKRDNKISKDIKSHLNSIKQFAFNIESVAAASKVTSLASMLGEFDPSLDIEINKFDSLISDTYQQIISCIEVLRTTSKDFDATFESSTWISDLQKTNVEYDAFVNSFNETNPGSVIDYAGLLAKKQMLDEKNDYYKELAKEKESLAKQVEDLYSTIIDHHKQLRVLRSDVISRWGHSSIAIHLDVLGNYEESEIHFREIIRKSGDEFKSEILTLDDNDEPSEGFIKQLLEKQCSERWDLLNSLKKGLLTANEASPNGFGVRFIRHIQKLASNTPEDIDRLAIWIPEDRIVLKLKRNGREEDIIGGSAGQRTAGMLSLLLSLDSVPLIIDQPEDDLDSRMVTDLIVNRFKELKPYRQIIVVTHNPNIAVNASSESIVELEFMNGQINKKCFGALQKREVRQAVCDVMEGGRTALESRYYRISKALSSN
jgi:DNA repair ATPase RecN/predicted metal-dependent phosphoesterase TrpH